MKKLLRILPYITMVWVAMYVSRDTGKIRWESKSRWTTKKQCMKAAKKIEKDEDGDDGDSRGTSSTLKRVAKMVRREEEENRRFSLKKELERIDRNEKEYVKDSVSIWQYSLQNGIDN